METLVHASGVSLYHEKKETSPLYHQEFSDSLDLLKVVGELRMQDAAAKDVITYRRAEVALSTGAPGCAFTLATEARYTSELWNEQVHLLF